MVTYSHKFAKVIGTSNAQLRFSFATADMQDLNIIFTSAGGNFASPSATVQVSTDEADWSATIDTLNLGTSAIYTRYYNLNNLPSGAALNPISFPYIRITVPALGTGKTATVQVSGKRSNTDDSGGIITPITNYTS